MNNINFLMNFFFEWGKSFGDGYDNCDKSIQRAQLEKHKSHSFTFMQLFLVLYLNILIFQSESKKAAMESPSGFMDV